MEHGDCDPLQTRRDVACHLEADLAVWSALDPAMFGCPAVVKNPLCKFASLR